MEWLTPLVGLYTAAVAVPVLLLLYFLKLKRQQVVVSSTLLWKRAVRDLQVNAPFQRLRRNLLLLLQLLALAAMLLALAGPVLAWRQGSGRRYVLLIDRSASMNATDVQPSRLASVKQQAETFVESMRGGSPVSFRGLGISKADHAMVVAFDNHAKVMCSFTSSKDRLRAAIEAIEAGDGASRLGEAVTMARAFAQSGAAEGDLRTVEGRAQLVLFSDGRIEDLDAISVTADELVFHLVGQSTDNVAITAMSARRSYEQPEQVTVFASLENYGAEPVSRDVQLGVNGDVRAVRLVRIPPYEAAQEGRAAKPGRVAVEFSFSCPGAGVVEVRQLGSDVLSCDDAAWAVLDAPRQLSILLVTNGNPVLESALRACPIARLDPCSPAGFDAIDPEVFTSRQRYDVVVLDNHVPAHLPPCRYLVFGPPPRGIDVNSPGQLENQVVIDWRSQHPALQYVNLSNLFTAKSYRLELPRDADVLAEFTDSPALAVVRRKGSVCLLAGFDALQSNWPFEPGFVLFCYNALSFLGAQAGAAERRGLEVGEPITVENLRPGTVATVTRPDASALDLTGDPGGVARFPGTQRAGVYAVDVPGRPKRFYAVNLLDSEESRIEPRRDLHFSGATVAAQEGAVQRANVPLWPVLVFAALVLACLEWLAYNLRVRI
jgi:hypothetical protein